MAAEATYLRDRHDQRQTTSAATVVGEVRQMSDGHAAVFTGLKAAAASDATNWYTEGQYTVIKTASFVFLDGQEVFWDHSANKAVIKASGDKDFYLGTAVGDAASAATTMVVNLNVKPHYVIDTRSDAFSAVVVATAGIIGVGTHGRGSNIELVFDTATEAQKCDAISVEGWAVGAKAIVEGRVHVVGNGDDAALDFNVGIANATHATDADSITESVFIHIDGNVLNILAESDDGTTEVAATDTTVDYVEGTAFDFVMDCRDNTDIQIYINGVNVLPASVFALGDATGPLKLLAHLEKTSNNTPGQVGINYLRCRIMEQ